MFSPNNNDSKDPNDEEPTSILRVFGDFNSRVRSSMGGNTGITQSRNMSSSGIMGGHQSASQKLRLDISIFILIIHTDLKYWICIVILFSIFII